MSCRDSAPGLGVGVGLVPGFGLGLVSGLGLGLGEGLGSGSGLALGLRSASGLGLEVGRVEKVGAPSERTGILIVAGHGLG